MPRIAGINVPGHMHIEIGLTRVYGVGRSLARTICKKLNFVTSTKVDTLTEAQLKELNTELGTDEYVIEGDLRREISLNIKRLKDLRCYRGIRHQRGLPLRGQRTKTNAKTRKKRRGGKKK